MVHGVSELMLNPEVGDSSPAVGEVTIQSPMPWKERNTWRQLSLTIGRDPPSKLAA